MKNRLVRCRRQQRVERQGVERMPAGRIVERGVNHAIGCRRHARVGLGPREVAEHRMAAARLHGGRFFTIADERLDLVTGANQRVENRRSDVPRAPRQKDSHKVRSTPLVERA